MSKGEGFGKIILFNEHFVVHGIPSIVSAINQTTVATVERVEDSALLVPSGNEGAMAGDGWVMEDERDTNPGYKIEKFAQQKDSMLRVFTAAGFNPAENNIKVTLGGKLKGVGGVGASAAVCVALARALNEEFGLGFDDERVNDIAYEGERAYAGTPSGVDNTASTYGGLLSFKKNMEGGKNYFELIDIEKPVRIVMGNTGETTDTAAAVAGVRKRKEEQKEKYDALFARADEIYYDAIEALAVYDLEWVGKLMNESHKLLQAIEVSHPKLDELVGIARENGALGAKMTGGGLGGYMVALTPDEKVQKRVADAMEATGYETVRTTIG